MRPKLTHSKVDTPWLTPILEVKRAELAQLAKTLQSDPGINWILNSFLLHTPTTATKGVNTIQLWLSGTSVGGLHVLTVVDSLVAVWEVQQMSHGEEGVTEDAGRNRALLCADGQHALQQRHKLPPVHLLRLHVAVVMTQDHVNLQDGQSQRRWDWRGRGLQSEVQRESTEVLEPTCAMSSRQLKMYFLASLDFSPVSFSCSSVVCRNKNTQRFQRFPIQEVDILALGSKTPS